MKIFKFFPLILILLLIFSCKKEISDEKNNNEIILKAKEIKKVDGFGVVNVNRLRFRSDNDLHSKTLRYLDKGTIVFIIKKDSERVKIGQYEDYWYQIEFEGIKGWVFGYYIDVFNNLDNATLIAKKYKNSITENTDNYDFFYDNSINNYFYYLNQGKIIKVIDGKNKKTEILSTEPGYNVVNYFFANNPDYIYYIAKKPGNFNNNGHLYKHDIKSGSNKIHIRNVFAADISQNKDKIITLTTQRSINSNYWQIRLIDLNNPKNEKEITKIQQNRSHNIKENDTFSLTLARELGSLAFLKLNDDENFIFFKPPEEALTYIISTLDGNFIKVEKDPESIFFIDSSQYISIASNQNDSGKIVYSLLLNDTYSGKQKEIITSSLYPINVTVSQRKNLIGISMINLDKIVDKYYSSSVYILSMSTYSLVLISEEGNSYQPKWSEKIPEDVSIQ